MPDTPADQPSSDSTSEQGTLRQSEDQLPESVGQALADQALPLMDEDELLEGGPLLVPAPGEPLDRFPIVALCGSAGSIGALEQFFRNLPAASGMAFVVVVHLAANQRSHLPEVLQQFTNMLVYEVEDGQRLRPNTVYVLPPDKDLSLLSGTLLLLPPTQAPGHRLPIDFFLQGLAKDARERAVAVIFSGMGSDGALGLKMVMENFGMIMAQEPETAEYAAMPRAALATEFVDYVLPAEELPAKLLEYARQPPLERPSAVLLSGDEAPPANALQKIFLLIRSQTGHDFSLYKRNTVFRRIDRRMNAHQIRDFAQYVRFLQETPQEVELLFKELLIGVTKFFRDPEAFEALQGYLLTLLQRKPVDAVVRVWAPGCSTGEEAYTLAMLLQECLDQLPTKYLKVQVFATDINPEGIDHARAGIYPPNIEGDVSPARLQRFFSPVEGGYQIRKEVRDVVVFALHNINKDAPFIKLDLLVCRNLLIYLSSELQRNLLPVFHYALNPDGLLLLGPSENLTGFQTLFTPLDVKWKISRRNDVPYSLARITHFPFSLAHQIAAAPVVTPPVMNQAPRKEGHFVVLIQKMLMRTFAPPAVVINSKGEILFVNGRTGRYLEPAPGLGTMNVFDMAREEMGFELNGAVHRAYQQHEDVTVEGIKLRTESGYQLIRLTVKYLDAPDALAGLLLVVFEDMPTSKRQRKQAQVEETLTRDSVVLALEKELQYTKHRLQTTVEEMESSLEELKSTNEELQSANEELQSTNEEAMTNKEEMQSLNEELMTLNVQYLTKTEELSLAANDMKNLLDATGIATIFLDNDMVIKRFTPSVARIIPLLPTDIGRPITHLANNLRYEGLPADVRQVLDRLVSVETNIQTRNGEWFAMRILPYRTLDNYISGAVITFIDITALKQLEEQLQASTALAESIIENLREPLLVVDGAGRVLSVNRSFAQAFHLEVEQVRGQQLDQLGRGAWHLPALAAAIRRTLDTGQGFDDLVVDTTFPELGPRHLRLYGRQLLSGGKPTGQLLLGVSQLSE